MISSRNLRGLSVIQLQPSILGDNTMVPAYFRKLLSENYEDNVQRVRFSSALGHLTFVRDYCLSRCFAIEKLIRIITLARVACLERVPRVWQSQIDCSATWTNTPRCEVGRDASPSRSNRNRRSTTHWARTATRRSAPAAAPSRRITWTTPVLRR